MEEIRLIRGNNNSQSMLVGKGRRLSKVPEALFLQSVSVTVYFNQPSFKPV